MVDACRSFKPDAYEIPLHDVAAMHYAVQPESGLFDVAEIGGVKRLVLGADEQAEASTALLAFAGVQVAAAQRGRIGG